MLTKIEIALIIHRGSLANFQALPTRDNDDAFCFASPTRAPAQYSKLGPARVGNRYRPPRLSFDDGARAGTVDDHITPSSQPSGSPDQHLLLTARQRDRSVCAGIPNRALPRVGIEVVDSTDLALFSHRSSPRRPAEPTRPIRTCFRRGPNGVL